MAEKLQDILHPAHKLSEEPIIVSVNLMNEFVKVILVTGAKVDERLNGLVWVSGDILALGSLEDRECIVSKGSKVGY